ncbi:carbon monoxide dehydrogenase subunit G [Dongia sp.]|uniref:SRPBCC family protein n=1 Tax=Dongia sp. TaxID=1977262 RepID=UPI0035B2EFCF
MQMTDSRRIPAPQEKVWAALNNPLILQAAIPGCESLEMTSPTEMTAKVTLKVGPVKATFGGKVTLSEIEAPTSYRITGEGSGGVAGFAKGGAVVRLEADGADATILHYTADAQIGGKLAQLGSRLIDSTAQKLAGDFFTAFATQLAEPVEEAAVGEEEEEKKSWFKNLFGKSETAGAVLLLAIGLGAAGAHICCLDPAHAEMTFPLCQAGVTS